MDKFSMTHAAVLSFVQRYDIYNTDRLFAQIIGRISALTILQYINYKNDKLIGRIKYALT